MSNNEEALPIIQTFDLTMRFGEVTAVDKLSLTIHKGDIFGFIGPNGAGKTTTMRILATLLKPTYGRAEVKGHDVVKTGTEVRHVIGYMPDFSGAYRDMEVGEYLEFFAAAYHIPREKRRRIVEDVLQLTDLISKRDDMIESLSRGMHQRLGLARVLIHDPEVLILDEPASGLDPRARIEIQEILIELQKMGKTIFISSHILSELKQLCNRIGIIEKGKLLFSGEISEAIRMIQGPRALKIKVIENAEAACNLLASNPQVMRATVEDGLIRVELDQLLEDFSFVAESLIGNGFKILTIAEEELHLEDAFMRLTQGTVA